MAQHAGIFLLQVIFLIFAVETAWSIGVAHGIERVVAGEHSIPVPTYILLDMEIEHWMNVAYSCYLVAAWAGFLLTAVSLWETVTGWADGVLAREEQA